MKKYALLLVALVALVTTPALANPDDPSINIDPQPIFDQITTWFPIFIGIFGILLALVLALLISRTVINRIRESFEV